MPALSCHHMGPSCFLRRLLFPAGALSGCCDASAVMSRLAAMLKDLPPLPDQEANVDQLCTQAREAIQESLKDNGARQQLEGLLWTWFTNASPKTCAPARVCETIPLRVRRDGFLNRDTMKAPLEYVEQCGHVVATQSNEGKASLPRVVLPWHAPNDAL